jgi:NAD(P)-dependent dehydrogenase (short-subunit alcohol dehydrogenase family)
MLAVTGYRSKIVQELIPLLPEGEELVAIADRGAVMEEARRFLLCAGVLRPARLTSQTEDEVAETMEVNCFRPIRLCEHILERFDDARICVIGSESAFTWSFDDTYAASKVALHRYVETRKIGPKQQLVCVAPSIIGDAAMTTARTDVENLKSRMDRNPKKRFLQSIEVAQMVKHLLYVDIGYTTNVVIRMNGGEHTL